MVYARQKFLRWNEVRVIAMDAGGGVNDNVIRDPYC